MRAVVQRVKRASVAVDGEAVGTIGAGLLVLLGIEAGDDAGDTRYIAEKCVNMRIFDDENDVMNLSVQDVDGEILLVSNFTLYGDIRKGRRPSYIRAAKPDDAKHVFTQCVNMFKEKYGKVETGVFQAMMDVSLVNDGPVTILLDSKKGF